MESSIQGLAIPLSSSKKIVHQPAAEVTRRSANYHPSIWGDHFLAYSSNAKEVDVNMAQQIQELKETVRNMLVDNVHNTSNKLDLIDAIQRLGVLYHFENEIEAILRKIYEVTYQNDHYKSSDVDLYTVSLSFRLLRQQGYPVSCDVFDKFKDNNGRFMETLKSDVRGMLSLYEAAHLRMQGENILDEALDFTTIELNFAVQKLSNLALKSQVLHALKQPIRTGLERLEARFYIAFYENDHSHNKLLLNFAKLDFNNLQKMHQKELSEITRWWKDLDFAKKLPFARDRIVECYFWILGVYFEPQYALARRILIKVIALTSIMDDIYDVYGTLDELELFTDAIERWDINAIYQLPEYMRLYYQALLDVYSMMEEEMAKEGRSYRVCYAKAAMKNLARAYFREAKWYHEDHFPTFDEYMNVALVSGAYTMLATTSFVGMGEMVTEKVFEWVSNDPLIVRASSVIARLLDDIVSHKFEQERGHVASAVECYMKQHGASEEEAYLEFRKRIADGWKDINAECLYPTKVSMPILTRILNLVRFLNIVYKDGDYYTHSTTKMKDLVTYVLVDPIPTSTSK